MISNRLLATLVVATTALLPLAAFAEPSPAPAAMAPEAAAPAPAPALPPSPNLMANGNLVATLKASGKFTILVKAIESTNLAGTLSTAPNITLFAPTDDAFRALPPGQLEKLMLPASLPLLQKVVIYHLVNLPLDSAKDLRGHKGPAKSVEGAELQIDGGGEVLMVNNADIIQADVHATNGYIHVIDKVLIPSDVPLAAAAASAPATGG